MLRVGVTVIAFAASALTNIPALAVPVKVAVSEPNKPDAITGVPPKTAVTLAL